MRTMEQLRHAASEEKVKLRESITKIIEEAIMKAMMSDGKYVEIPHLSKFEYDLIKDILTGNKYKHEFRASSVSKDAWFKLSGRSKITLSSLFIYWT